MSFLNAMRDLRRHTLDESMFCGVVVDNEDPLQLGRIRVRVKEVHGTQSPDDQLPWAGQLKPSFLGGGPELSGFSVPDIGTGVYISFHRGSIYSPFYVSAIMSELTKWSDMSTNYPNRYGMIDSNGTKIIVDKVDQSVEMLHVSGTKFTVDKDGNVTWTNPGNAILNVDGNVTAHIGGNLDSDVDGNAIVTVDGNVDMTVGVDATLDVTGDVDVTASTVKVHCSDIEHDADGSPVGNVTLAHVCAFTGQPHPEGSSTVKSGG